MKRMGVMLHRQTDTDPQTAMVAASPNRVG